MANKYQNMTDQDFDTILEQIVSKMSASQILAIGDVNMILREELNNDVLNAWEFENPEKIPGECCGHTQEEHSTEGDAPCNECDCKEFRSWGD